MTIPKNSTVSLLLLAFSLLFSVATSLSTDIPPLGRTVESLTLSNAIYSIHRCEDVKNNPDIPSHISCHTYETKHDGTQVAVLSSDFHKYVAVVFAGTDNVHDIITDVEISMKPFGPIDSPINPDARVHEGFNSAVFGEGLFDRIFTITSDILQEHPDYKLITTGHSLGAANSLLIAVALSEKLGEDVPIENISFACPRTGDETFRNYANQMKNVGIWRVVFKDDIVPRIPLPHRHPGHTIQLDRRGAKVYYLHYGDEDNGYAGVPESWETRSFLDVPMASLHHVIRNYIKYITKKSSPNPLKYYADEFVSMELGEEYGDEYDYEDGDEDNASWFEEAEDLASTATF
eukprot:CAMPEP_0195517324 /NCGR_PEP_ID=MMETSP0794_2-20130614/10365_1 /TAXON_ID=515487 /ORGANISM="Stephanopyxis turris, Strain CCMP 815" /LENGTH=346 /DNA_ID=CAMNT_0040646107 /DNA_START=81 /DNA_END=1121 /DNA_ORIENTATION=-